MPDKKNKKSDASLDALKNKASADDALNNKLEKLNDQLDYQIDYFDYPDDDQVNSEENKTPAPKNIEQKVYDTLAVEDDSSTGDQVGDDSQDGQVPDDATAVLVQTFDVKPGIGITNKKERVEYQNPGENNKVVNLEVIQKLQDEDENQSASNGVPYDKVVTFGDDSATDNSTDLDSKNDQKFNTITGNRPEIVYPSEDKAAENYRKYDPDAKATETVEPTRKELDAKATKKNADKKDKKLKRQQANALKAEEKARKQLPKQAKIDQKYLDDYQDSQKRKSPIKLSTIGSIVGALVIAGLVLFGINYFDNRTDDFANDANSTGTIAPTNQLVVEKAWDQEPAYFTDDFIDKIESTSSAIDSVQLTTQLTGHVDLATTQQDFANAVTIYQADANITAGTAPVATNNILLSEMTAKLIAGDDNYMSLLGQTIDIRVDVPLTEGGYQGVQGQVIVTGFTDNNFDQVPQETMDILYRAAKVDGIKPNRAIINLNQADQANQVFKTIRNLDSVKINNVTLNN